MTPARQGPPAVVTVVGIGAESPAPALPRALDSARLGERRPAEPGRPVICDYGDVSAEQKKKFLLSHAPLRNVSAVRHRRIISLDYADLVESPGNPSAIARLGAYLRTVPAGR